ncbi:F-box/LRR-repeat protein 17-like isoform X2 [Schistocerca gregaria]|uniref:F-box/LRR-repeat protein 17-like isoform X2 n=1 Tax=Schistocerca gregaria TaxID=7010 RepID=UPI00211F1469|nr:F-box/LRR-repeat protein 17-like isoform X2 [Schistocerca gregaria]
MATSSPTVPLRRSEDTDTVFNSSGSPTSSADGDNISGVPLVSDLELNDRRHSEGEGPLQAASSTSKQDCRGTTVDDLPDELMLEIFSYVSFSENIKFLQKVCTRWRILAQDAHLWLHEKYIIRCETSEEEAIATFTAAPQLRTVILYKEVSPKVFEALSRSCPHLTTLEMYPFQTLTCSEADNLFAGCREIRTLSISVKGRRANVKLLDAVARLADLQVLHIQQVDFVEEMIPLRNLAEGCPHLCDLRIGGDCGLCYQIRDAEYFISSHKCVLKVLRTRLTSVEGRSIVPLLPACAEVLEHLELMDYGEISAEEATETLTALGKLHNLRCLHFGTTKQEVRHLVPAVFENGRLQKLQQLQLSYIVEQKTLCAVAKRCPDLQELELLRCEGHTDTLFEPLHRLKKLETELEIDYCDGDQDVLDRISAQMPDLRVKGTLGALITDESYEEGDYE